MERVIRTLYRIRTYKQFAEVNFISDVTGEPFGFNSEGQMRYLLGEYITEDEYYESPSWGLSNMNAPVMRYSPHLIKFWKLHGPDHSYDEWFVARENCYSYSIALPPWSGKILKEEISCPE